jgi:hypothetical protein
MYKHLSISLILSAALTLPAMAQGQGPLPQNFMPGLSSVSNGQMPSVGGILQSILNPYGNSGGMRNGLPQTSMDSFVYEAKGQADAIYGDEGDVGLPPYDEYTKEHRINAGIFDRRNAGLTTGHGSYLPDATGGDEWVDGPEWSQSGANGGNGNVPGGFNIGLGGLGNLGIGPGGAQLNGPGGLNLGLGQGGLQGGIQTPIGNFGTGNRGGIPLP